MKTIVTNLNGGVYTPKIDVRIDTEKYISGCRISDNMIPRIYGSSSKRTGTEFIVKSRWWDA